MKQLLARVLVDQRPEARAQLRQEGGADVVVFQHNRLPRVGPLGAVVVVVDGIGQDAVHAAPAHVLRFFLGDHVAIHGDVGVSVRVLLDVRQRIVDAQRGGRHGVAFHSQG